MTKANKHLALVEEEFSNSSSASDDDYILSEAEELELFGFTLKKDNKKAKQKEEKSPESFAEPSQDDGSDIFISAGAHQIAFHNVGQYNDQSDITRIKKYREIASYPECDQAIEEIINEIIQIDDEFPAVELSVDEKEISEKVRKQFEEEFDNILRLLSFSTNAYDIVRKWYVDGRILFHIILDEKQQEIVELRPIDPLYIKKIKEVEKVEDPETKATIYRTVDEYFLYSENMDDLKATTTSSYGHGSSYSSQALKIHKDAIIYVGSGLLDESRKNVISYLHKAIRPLNQLRMLEDAMLVYKLVRAPERRIFRVDVGGLPAKKAEAYMENIIAKFRNKITYNAQTGELSDGRQQMAMIEDFWLPTRDGGRGTQIDTLPSSGTLADTEELGYFQKKLFRSLNVPLNRLEQEAQFSLGRSSEISRDEVKFSKFVARLRSKFSDLFYQALKVQLVLKKVISEDEWDDYKQKVFVNFLKDNYFTELKESEIIKERLNTLREIDEYVGKYYSKEWVRRNVLRQTDGDIDDIDKQMDNEKEEEPNPDDGDDGGMGSNTYF
jgi:hypothetical protein